MSPTSYRTAPPRVTWPKPNITIRFEGVPGPSRLPDYVDIEAAAAQLSGIAHRTPIVTSRTVDARTGAHVFFKCENVQRAGAFKFRGAYNALSRLSPDERRRGGG